MKIFPRKTKTAPVEKTSGPHGKSLELRAIPRRTIVVLHEFHTHTTPRYKELGNVPNRATRRAYARGRGRGFPVPAPTMTPYETPRLGTTEFDVQAQLYARGAVPVYR